MHGVWSGDAILFAPREMAVTANHGRTTGHLVGNSAGSLEKARRDPIQDSSNPRVELVLPGVESSRAVLHQLPLGGDATNQTRDSIRKSTASGVLSSDTVTISCQVLSPRTTHHRLKVGENGSGNLITEGCHVCEGLSPLGTR